jgi:hypothetical protein
MSGLAIGAPRGRECAVELGDERLRGGADHFRLVAFLILAGGDQADVVPAGGDAATPTRTARR